MSEKYDYDAIIIGAGIGGLTAGNILAKNGMKVLILEKNPVPGGAVSTFYRNGYPIDISHSLCAMKEGAFLRRAFDYLDIYKKLEFLELEKAFVYIPENEQNPIFCYADPNKYREELNRHFPHQKRNIEKLFNAVESIWSDEIIKSYYNPSLPKLLSYLFYFPNLFKYRNHTFDKFLNRFTKAADLKDVMSVSWPYIGLDRELVSALYMICVLGAYHKDRSYFVKGGFGKIVNVLAANFKALGGNIIYNSAAEKVLLTKGNIAYGVRDNRGNIYTAKNIISNIDSKKTFLDLLEADNISRNFGKKVSNLTMSCSAIQVHFVAEAEINKDFLSTGTIMLPSHVDLEKKLQILFKHDAQPYSKTALIASINRLQDFIDTKEENTYVFNLLWLPAQHSLWDKFIDSKGKDEYENIKNEIVLSTIMEMKKICHIREVKFSNVLTPISFEKWLNSSQGAIYDLASSPDQMLLKRFKNSTPIGNLHLVGAKTFPGAGMAGAICSAVSLSDSLLGNKLTKGKFVL